MLLKRLTLLAALSATTALAACGGGGGTGGAGSLTPPGGGNTQSTQSKIEDAISSAEALGSPVKDFASYDDSTSSPLQSAARHPMGTLLANGTCNKGVEFFAPDKNNDANSTERIVFYDSNCTQVAVDTVRIYSSTGANAETVSRTVSLYALNTASPVAVNSQTVNYSHATFDQYGYPVYKNGFARTQAGEIDINGVKTIDSDDELVVAATSGDTSAFCSDSAGFSATGNAALNETFGWAGIMPSGTRTTNSDGSVTWNTTRTGTSYTGAIGALSIQTGAQNTACPISTPMFTLAGGTAKGTYILPLTATFTHGVLTSLTVQNATLLNGETLNVQTNTSLSPSDTHFISGTLAEDGTNLASFNVSAFGDGVLVTVSGKAYTIVDWHVVK